MATITDPNAAVYTITITETILGVKRVSHRTSYALEPASWHVARALQPWSSGNPAAQGYYTIKDALEDPEGRSSRTIDVGNNSGVRVDVLVTEP